MGYIRPVAVRLVVLLLFAGGLHAVPTDAGKLSGLLRAVGYDGALEATENPAYLAIPRDTKRIALALEGGTGFPYEPDLRGFNKERMAGSYNLHSAIAFSAAELLESNWAVGLTVGSAGNPLWANQKLSASTDTLSFNSLSRTWQPGSTFALAYKLDEENALGFSFFSQYGGGTEERVFGANLNLPPPVQFTQKSVERFQEIIMAPVIGYLLRSGDSEFGLSVIPAGWMKRDNRQNLSQRIEIESFNYDVTENFNDRYITSNLLVPQFNAGVAQNLFSFLRLYAELGLTAPVKEIERFGEYDNSKMIRYETTDPSGVQVSLAGGIALSLPQRWYVFAGFIHISRKGDREYTTSYAEYYLLRRQSNIWQQLQLGAGYHFTEHFGLFLGTYTSNFQMTQLDNRLKNNIAEASDFKVAFWESGLYLSLHYNPGG